MKTPNLWNLEFPNLKTFVRLLLVCTMVVSVLFITNSCAAVLASVNMPPYKSKLTIPADNATNIQTNVTLEWEASHDPEGKALFYSIYLDTKSPPKAKVATDLTDTHFSTKLKSSTTYYWQVIVRDEGNSTNESDIWSFSTKRYNIKKK